VSRRAFGARSAALLLAGACIASAQAQSTCYGTTTQGRIDNAVALPREGANFVRMSQGPISATRVYVHTMVHDVMLETYAALASP